MFWILTVGPMFGAGGEAAMWTMCSQGDRAEGLVSVDIRVPDRSEGDQDPGAHRVPQKPAMVLEE